MNVLDSPFEALIFDYASFGIFTVVNNLWTWVALITAALSFWRIRTATSSTAVKSPLPSDFCIGSRPGNETDHRPQRADQSDNSTSSPESSFPEATALSSRSPGSGLSGFNREDGVTKGKFVEYYEDDCKEGYQNGVSDDLTVAREWGYGGLAEWPERVLVRMKMGDLGWYTCQDLTVINGNVVRLWDDVRRRNSSSSLGCVVW